MKRKYEIKFKGKKYEVEVEEITSPEILRMAGQVNKPYIPPPSQIAPREIVLKDAGQKTKSAGVSGGKEVTAPMSGTVLSIDVKIGDDVKTGDLLLKLEAMKMETAINATADGKVSEIFCSKGQSVTAGEPLIGLE
ncbi:biotin/lipoyl-binding protein [candidate division WOR-3 bacterium]|nr:biotin/lipoyl-binding protein [candidate division WOR-3 bacterium]